MQSVISWWTKSVSLAFVGLLASCGSLDTAECDHSGSKFFAEWKRDSLGCDRFRYDVIRETEWDYRTLKGLDEACVRALLGPANGSHAQDDGSSRIYYYLSCGLIKGARVDPSSPGGLVYVMQESTEATILLVEFDPLGIVTDVRTQVP